MYVEFICNAEYLCSMDLTVNEVKERWKGDYPLREFQVHFYSFQFHLDAIDVVRYEWVQCNVNKYVTFIGADYYGTVQGEVRDSLCE